MGVGAVALVEAARRFDPSHGVPFAGFAFRRVKGAMQDASGGRSGARGARPEAETPCRPRRAGRGGLRRARGAARRAPRPARRTRQAALSSADDRGAARVRGAAPAHRARPRSHRIEGLAVVERRPAAAAGGSGDRAVLTRCRRPPRAGGEGAQCRRMRRRRATLRAMNPAVSPRATAAIASIAPHPAPSGGASDRLAPVGSRGHRLEGLRLLQPQLRRALSRACAGRRPPSGTGRCRTCAPGCRSRTRCRTGRTPPRGWDAARRAAARSRRAWRAPCSTSTGCRWRGWSRTRRARRRGRSGRSALGSPARPVPTGSAFR